MENNGNRPNHLPFKCPWCKKGFHKLQGSKSHQLYCKSRPSSTFNKHDEIRIRRNKVYELRIKGHTYSSIARKLKISERTAYEDMKEIIDNIASEITSKPKSRVLAETMLCLEAMERDFRNEYFSAKKPSDKIGFGKLYLEAWDRQIRLLSNSGLLNKEEEPTTPTINGKPIHMMTDLELRERRDHNMKEILRLRAIRDNV